MVFRGGRALLSLLWLCGLDHEKMQTATAPAPELGCPKIMNTAGIRYGVPDDPSLTFPPKVGRVGQGLTLG